MFNVKELSWIPIMCALLFAPTLCLAAAGDLDLTFGDGGLVITDIDGSHTGAEDVAIQADGKILVAGDLGWDFALARYNPDGTLDTGFGADGQVTTDFGASHDEAYGVVIQTDGKILVAGASYVPSTGWDFALARYNSDGTLDNSFGTDGKVTTDFTASGDSAEELVIQDDGKIVVAGYSADTYGPSSDFCFGSLYSKWESGR